MKTLNLSKCVRSNLSIFAIDLMIAIFAVAMCYAMSMLLVHPVHAQTSTRYNGGYQQPSAVIKGRVITVRDVSLHSDTSQTGQYIGQALGGVLGALMGQRSNNYAIGALATTVGTIAGGALGSQVGSSSDAQEIVIAFDDGRTSAITQSVADGVRFSPGQKVMIIGAGRVAPSL